jgi:hypothetical protein
MQNALLIAASMTPFSQAATQASTARGQESAGALLPDPKQCNGATAGVCTYYYTVFGILWAVTLSFNCFGLAMAMLLLGYMLAVPDIGIYKWAVEMSNQRWLGLPAFFTLAGTLMFIISVNYSAAVYYGLAATVTMAGIFAVAIVTGLIGRCIVTFGHLYPGLMNSADSAEVPGGSTPAAPGTAQGEHTSRSALSPHGDLEAGNPQATDTFRGPCAAYYLWGA